MTWTRNKTNPQLRHCENCSEKFSTTDSAKIRCNKCENPTRFCVKCGNELDAWVDMGTKWCSDKCKEKLGKEFVVKQVKVCNGCRKEIAGKSTVYQDKTKQANCWHIFCMYENIKKRIEQNEQSIKYRQENIESSKKDIIETQKEVEAERKEMLDLAEQYPSEIVGQLL